MLNPNEASQIVDDSIFMAGGDQGPFPGDPTLKQAGLVVGHQRDSFQRKIARNTRPFGYKVKSVGRIPSLAGTKRSDVVTWLQDVKNVEELG